MSLVDGKSKVALITGVTGQDGRYLTKLLLSKGYEVHGLKRRPSGVSPDAPLCFAGEELPVIFHSGDMTDTASLIKIIKQIQPDEIYNLAAQSHVGVSFQLPEYTSNGDALGPLRILEAIRSLRLEKKTRFYQASSSELFGLAQQVPQTEKTPFYPRSPYAVAKLYAYWITVNYREAYGLYACSGILYNHESPLRGSGYVTRKITRTLSLIKLGLEACLFLGNLDAKRDWGHAKDYVELQWLMLQQDQPEDFVIGTGVQHSVQQFVDEAAKHLDMTLIWKGEGLHKHAIDEAGKIIVSVDPRFFRPTEVGTLLADPSKAKRKLGWEPKASFSELVKEMVDADYIEAKKKAFLKDQGNKAVKENE